MFTIFDWVTFTVEVFDWLIGLAPLAVLVCVTITVEALDWLICPPLMAASWASFIG